MRFWDAVKAAMRGVEDDGRAESPGGPEDCARLRRAAFARGAGSLALPADWGGRPYGAIVETGTQGGAATLVAFATGEAHLYVSTGGGAIGRASHVHVVVQAKRLVRQAADQGGGFEAAAAACPLPSPGQTRFYLMTAGGLVTAAEPTARLAAGQSPLSPLFETAQDLLSEFLQLTR